MLEIIGKAGIIEEGYTVCMLQASNIKLLALRE
jgi:hypothetical protein